MYEFRPNEVNPFNSTMLIENEPRKVQNLELLSLFVFFFALTCLRIFIKTQNIESKSVIGPENTLSAGASVDLSARKFNRLGQ